MKRKNILLVTADQWRGDCLSGLGHPHVKTPNFDALIADGIAFDHYYSVCVPCAPARASLLTGMYLQNHRVTRNGTPLDNRHTNIARELRKTGYKPTLFGYTDTALDPREFSEEEVREHGYESMMPDFDEGLLLPGETPEKWLKWLRKKGYSFESFDDAFSPIENSADKNQGRAAHAVAYKAEHSQTAFLTQHVIEYIDQHLANPAMEDEGRCIHLSYLRPHPPFVAPEPYNSMYDPALIKVDEIVQAGADEHPWLKAARGTMGDWPEPWMQKLADSEDYNLEVSQIIATYYGLITKVDHYFGMLIEHLKNSNEYENTLIIMTSNHGELMGNHGLFGKRGYFKDSYHISLIIRDPSQPSVQRGRIEKSFTESVDIMPTILDWLGSSIPRQCDGKSLLPFISGTSPKNWRKNLHWEYDFHDTKSSELEQALGIKKDDCKLNVISDNDYMFVCFASLPALFFDLHNDPNTEHNVIDKPEYASLVIEYSQRLLSWRMRNDERVLTGYSVSREEIYQRNS